MNKWVARSSQKFVPLQASLELTNRCNERCTHCYIPSYVDDPARVLSFQQWQKVLRELRSGGVLYLIMMGGEAMLNRHFWKIAEETASLGFQRSMITNGLLINARNVQRLADLNFSNLTFSLYSHDPAIHDAMTQVPGSHARTVRALRLCRDSGIDVYINCLITRDNVATFFDFAAWCKGEGIYVKTDTVVTPRYDHDPAPLAYRATIEQLETYYRDLREHWPFAVSEAPPVDPNDYICNAAKGKCAVTAYGELLPCIEIREPLGSLVDQSFSEAWHSPSAQKWRSLKQKNIKTDVEDTVRSYCDHCPGMAHHETGDPLKMAPYHAKVGALKAATVRKDA